MTAVPRDYPHYTYAALPDAATHIRLLQILPRHGKAPLSADIRISILTVPFHIAPPYHAVSYTWGDPNDEEHFTVATDFGNRHLVVRKNCADVLWQLDNMKPAKNYWVDAICIDQSDEKEKSLQVALMGEIYRRAERVCVCLGMYEGDDCFLAAVLREFDEFLASEGQSTVTFFSGGNSWTDEKTDCLFFGELWLEGLSDGLTLRLCRALDQFTTNTYFKRVWTLQELYLARRVSIFRGLQEISLSTLLFWWRDSKVHWFFRDGEEVEPGSDSPVLLRKLTSSQDGRDYLYDAEWSSASYFEDEGGSCLGRAYEDLLHLCALPTDRISMRSKVPLDGVIELCEKRLCQDPRDTVYGTLALADWNNATSWAPTGLVRHSGGALRPDYGRSSFDIAKEVVLHFHNMSDIWLLTYMLKLHLPSIEVSSAIEQRQECEQTHTSITSDDVVVRLAEHSGQYQVQVTDGCVQLTDESCRRIEYVTRRGRKYATIIDEEGEVQAVTSSNIKLNDWILPTARGFGFLLRQTFPCSNYFMVVGRASVTPHFFDRVSNFTAFMVWFGVEDLMVHMAHVRHAYDWGAQLEPGEGLLGALNLPFCARPYSSFAEKPFINQKWSTGDIRVGINAMHQTLFEKWRSRVGNGPEEPIDLHNSRESIPEL